MSDLSYFTKTASDWRITSYGDVGAYVGYGGKVSHMKFYSPSLNLRLNTVLLLVGIGAGVDVSPTFLKGANTALENFFKGKDSVNAESGYKTLACHKPFSLNDIDGATCGAIDTAASIPFGYKTGFFHASANGNLIFSVPAVVEPNFGFKLEAAAAAGRFFSLGNQYLAAMNEGRKQRELGRTPSSPLVRPAGGF